ncbi:MAG: hypothetical protein A2W90_14535 [Bacteroidetes bacterium GWF2_42_66]|nr:MAG: hypothetical protein A2W92_15930 [Bacteroidetes bacterium GWA2_42_15]OFX99087.1 MAG: hypothetical protein A2W89_06725 [Bacteroidetes bacterium GWE2_42_39]OFY46744.1 MAG: hypothetical protein A2W90_14535 [Bacteroidetes bacterium GWF2_42_66]HAZ00691.1 hypothetical protein [Marinilabiliales bacterium]HBL73850.1 hypothetical protein [Prolixibacteraceae bacterium]
MQITEKIKSFEDACAHHGIEPNIPDVSGLMPKHQEAVVNFYKLSVITSALNEGWEKDWNNYNEYIYYPWWYVETLGSFAGLADAFTSYAVSYADALLGSRLGFKTRELARYAASQFRDIYREIILFTYPKTNGNSDQSE